MTPDFVSDIIREFIIRAEDTNPLTRVEGDIVSNAFDDLEVEYNVDIISDLVDKSIELGVDVDNLVDLKGLMYQMDSTIKDMKPNVSLTSMDIDELSKRILKLYNKLGVPSLGQLRKLETSKKIERDIERINDNYVVLSLYTLHPPRRNVDYSLMKISNNMNDDKYNYLDLKKGQFVFNNYKTLGKYHQVVVPIENDLMQVIELYLNNHPEEAKLKSKNYDVHFLKIFYNEPIEKPRNNKNF